MPAPVVTKSVSSNYLWGGREGGREGERERDRQREGGGMGGGREGGIEEVGEGEIEGGW